MTKCLSTETTGGLTDAEWLNLLNLTELQRQSVADANLWTREDALRRLPHVARLAKLTLERVTALCARLEGR